VASGVDRSVGASASKTWCRSTCTDEDGTRRTVPFDLVDAASISQTFQVLRTRYAKIGEVLYANPL
jgi:hypothetical protein